MFWELIGSEQQSLGLNKPSLRNSKLGWLIAGPIPIVQSPRKFNQPVICNFLIKEENLNLDQGLAKFWELENIPQVQPRSEEEKLCEKHYLSNTSRQTDGRFVVGPPLKKEIDSLGHSYNTAKKRFLNLENRFRKHSDLKKLYT